MRKQNWDGITAKEGFDSPSPGAYIARVDNVADNETKQYLKIEWDFAEGQYKGHNRETFDRANFWPNTLYRSYKDSALGFFKAFKTALEESNPRYHFDEDHLDDMEGRLIGVVLGEEEYQKRDGTTGKRLYVAQTRSIDAIRRGDFKIPDLKRLTAASYVPPTTTQFSDLDEDDGEIPF